MKFALTLLIMVSVFISVECFCLSAMPVPPEGQNLNYDREILIKNAGKGFAQAVGLEKASWYDCGKVTPVDEYETRGIYIARCLKDALDEVGLFDPQYLWGSLAIVFQESRGNACSIGPNSRSWAKDNSVLNLKKHWTRFDKEDVLRVVDSKKFKTRRVGADAGIGQTIFPHNSEIYDMTSKAVRLVTTEELFTVEWGARTLAFHMLENTQLSKTKPWYYWPGFYDENYARNLAFHVSRMGGPYKKIYKGSETSKPN